MSAINIPNSVTTIGDYAFYCCTNLITIDIPNSVTSIGNSAFVGCNNLMSFTVNSQNPRYSSLNGVLFDKSQIELIAYPSVKNETQYNIPNTVNMLTALSFGYCTRLTSVFIPSSVAFIGEAAFLGCKNLTSIHVNVSVPISLYTSINVFSNVNKVNCTLYVPVGSKNKYASAYQWKDFVNIIEEDFQNGIETLTPDKMGIRVNGHDVLFTRIANGIPIQIVSTDGKIIANKYSIDETFSISIPDSGIYVIRVGNQSCKVMIY